MRLIEKYITFFQEDSYRKGQGSSTNITRYIRAHHRLFLILLPPCCWKQGKVIKSPYKPDKRKFIHRD